MLSKFNEELHIPDFDSQSEKYAQKKKNFNRKTIVFDLDETLFKVCYNKPSFDYDFEFIVQD